MVSQKERLLASVASFLAVLVSLPFGAAYAQTASSASSSLEEITVTAQRREEKLQTVPLAITALSSAAIEKQQINQTLDLAEFVPGMVAHNNTGLGSANTYYIRGLGNTESIATFDPAVGTYIDDIYIARQNLNNFGLFDVERIEVLRGPQGTLFGRNTTGGAIDIILKKPSDHIQGYFEVGGGKYDAYEGRGSIDLPITDKILTKFSFFGHHDEGWATDVTTGDKLNFNHSYGLRGAVRILPTDSLTWDVTLDYISENYANYLNFVGPNGDRVSHSGFLQGGLAGLVYGGKANYGPTALTETTGISSNLGWDVSDALSLNVIAGYRTMQQQFANDFFDFPLSPAGGFNITNLGRHEQYSVEVKATGKLLDGALDYVAGYYFFRENAQTDFADIFNWFFISPAVFGTTPVVLSDRLIVNSTVAHAIYTQWDYHVTDQLTLTAGVRFTDEVKRFDVNSDPVVAPFPSNLIIGHLSSSQLAAAGIPHRIHTALPTPRFAAQFQLDPDVMMFASITRGFKSGGWNARGESTAADTAFAPEKVWSEEVGVRSDWFDKTLRLNLTGFYAYDEQIQIPAEELINGVATFNTTNPADMEIYGIELETQWLPTPDLILQLAASTQHASYQNVSAAVTAQQAACRAGNAASCNAGFVDSTGNVADPVRVPDYTIALTGTYNLDTQIGTFSPTATVSILGPHAIGTAGDDRSTSDPKAYVGTQWLLDMGLTYTPAFMPDVSFTAECKNCLSKDYPVSLLPPNQFLNNPGIWDVKLRYKFDVSRAEAAAPEPYAPPAPAAAVPSVPRSYLVFFDFDKADLTPEGSAIVDKAASNAKTQAVTRIEVTGHTDTVGSDAYNLRLSKRRAESVAAALEAKGVGSDEIAIFAKGKREPLVPTGDGVKEPQNRRVEIVYAGGAGT